MLFKILVILHTLGATVWAGGHLLLAVTVLPQALKNREPDRIRQFEQYFEGFGFKFPRPAHSRRHHSSSIIRHFWRRHPFGRA